jgi:two-component system, cell cycle sensor histidine kinase and response regulator CckA
MCGAHLPPPQGGLVAHSAHKGRILIVEDDALLRRILVRTLTNMGWQVLAAEDGIEALEHLEGGRPDAVLSDVEMPRLDGLGLLKRIAERWPGLPVVLMSGNPEVDVSAVSPHFVAKPCTPAVLEHVLQDVLAANVRLAVI